MTGAQENEAVLAFIRERQAGVLTAAVRELSACTADELAAVAHAASGSLGSYQMDAAFATVMRLRSVLDDASASEEDVERARRTALSELRDIEAGTTA